MTEQDQGQNDHPADSQSRSAPPPPPPADASTDPPVEELIEEPVEQDSKAMEALAMAMPLVLSLLFHVGIFLVLMFFVFAFGAEEVEEVKTTESTRLTDVPTMSTDPQQQQTNDSAESDRTAPTPAEQVANSPGQTSAPLAIHGQSTQGSDGASFETAGGGKGVTFAGSAAVGYNIVYVIDRSGSMIDTFSFVKSEMYRSIGRLDKDQYFHVILFAEGAPLEPKSRRLLPAIRRNQHGVVKFLENQNASGQTDPLPALERAFAVLANNRRSADKQSKLIFLLTDASFDNPPKILEQIRKWNDAYRSRGEDIVHINTLQYALKDARLAETMKQIASENGGTYQFVEQGLN